MWFDPTSYTVSERDGVVTLTIRTNAPGGPPPGSVEFYTLDGTAISKPEWADSYNLVQI